MGLNEFIFGIVGLGVLIGTVWFVERYKKNDYDDLDFYDGEENEIEEISLDEIMEDGFDLAEEVF